MGSFSCGAVCAGSVQWAEEARGCRHHSHAGARHTCTGGGRRARCHAAQFRSPSRERHMLVLLSNNPFSSILFQAFPSIASFVSSAEECNRVGDHSQVFLNRCMLNEPVVPPKARNVITNSAKYAHYGPGLVQRSFRYSNLNGCVSAAVTGHAPMARPRWLSVPDMHPSMGCMGQSTRCASSIPSLPPKPKFQVPIVFTQTSFGYHCLKNPSASCGSLRGKAILFGSIAYTCLRIARLVPGPF